MIPASHPAVRDLVLVGGGHAHALVLRMWAMDPLPGTRLTLINPGPAAPYTGMLPGHIAGHYSRHDLMIDLVRLARFAGARLILDAATGLDLDARLVHLSGQPPLPFDIASIDTGITSDLPDLAGAAAYATPAKPLGAYAARWDKFLARRLAFPRITIIGGGIGGVELAMASAFRLQQLGTRAQITVVDQGPQLLPGVGRAARSAILREAAALGIRFLTGALARAVTETSVTLTTGETLGSDFTLTVTNGRPNPWFADTGLALANGFLAVSATLQTSDPAVFAVGDCAHLTENPRPKAGVFAVRAAPVLHRNLRASLTGGTLRRFRPQRDYLKLVSTGGQSAVADKFGLRLSGHWLWRLKHRIDTAFMARFAAYPAMPLPAVPREATSGLAETIGQKPLCGGCGAKLGPSVLHDALAALPAPQRRDVLSGPGDDAAILATAGGVQVMTTDHLRAFTNDPRVMARITAIHAMGDVWAMGAAPQVALAQITLPRLGPALQARMLAEIMQAATEVFRAAGADIVGGHTSQGAELTIGFTVTGIANRAVTKAGAQPGDVLILTKPIGSGTILAAEMAMALVPGLLLGEAVATCLGIMQRPLGAAAAILAPHAHAMTDITGFGLAGHLLELLEASGAAATISLANLPLIPGAEALANAGHSSSLAAENRAGTIGRMTTPDTPRAALLHDPQTAGGLLAAIPADQAESVLDALASAGETAALIGHITEGRPYLTVTA
ncbi:selenide, water dikinase SelD [Tabrizicola sp.]|uniref:selenide, water dikinase SelD n=1 Tax=Tabrizicola sp. TaxID=2005166 RepID=UPI00286A4E9A|nr:selenide, water dikinase SelD [Tabrizicola sp.]